MKLLIVTFCTVLVFAFVCFGLIGTGYASAATEEQANQSDEVSAVQATVTQQTGLGLGINVVTATSIRDFKTGYSILENDALQNLATSRLTLNTSSSFSYSTTSEKTLANQFENTLSAGLGADVFLTGLKTELQTGSNFDFDDYGYKYFYVLSQSVRKYNLYLNMLPNL